MVVADRGVAAAAGRGRAVRPNADQAELGRAGFQSRASAAVHRQRAAGGISRPGDDAVLREPARSGSRRFPASAAPPRRTIAHGVAVDELDERHRPGIHRQGQTVRSMLEVAANFFEHDADSDAARPADRRRATSRRRPRSRSSTRCSPRASSRRQNPIGRRFIRDAAANARESKSWASRRTPAIHSLKGEVAGGRVPAVHVRSAVDRIADLRTARGGRPDGAGRARRARSCGRPTRASR